MSADLHAVKHYLATPKTIRVGEVEYNFVVRAQISLAWIRPEHVADVMAIKKKCCGGQKKRIFRWAGDDDIRRWTNGGGR
jgi:hypothetical protein